MSGGFQRTADSPSLKALLLSWVALLALLALTLGSAYLHLGIYNSIINLVIAGVKATIVMLLFMHLNRSRPVLRLVASAGFLWLGILLSLSLADFLQR